jgi:leucyl-tRNA synthetase
MELVNETNKVLKQEAELDDTGWSVIREAAETTIVLLSPVVPHITEELWQILGNRGSLLNVPWPKVTEDALAVEKRLVVIQVNGKVRSRMDVPATFGQKEIEAEALRDERIRQFVGEGPIKRVIVVQKKLVNIVV